MDALIAALKEGTAKAQLVPAPAASVRDRSAANLALSGQDVLDDEAERCK